MQNTDKQPKIILGSASPRRRELLERLGVSFEIIKPDVPEVHLPNEDHENYVIRNARAKATWVVESLAQIQRKGDFLVVAADTIVCLEDEVLEKPDSEEEARAMLSRLSGNCHLVRTGVCLVRLDTHSQGVKEKAFSVTSEVNFKNLTEGEIAAYVATGEPLDKAGAYAAQGMGSYIVKSIFGSYTNVVGLPLAELVQILEDDFQFRFWK